MAPMTVTRAERRWAAADAGDAADARDRDRGAGLALSVVVPAYDEARRLESSLPRLLDYLARFRPESEVIVVDDGSRDETARVATQAAGAGGRVRVVRHARNRGKGAAVRTGVRLARGRVVVFLDADLSTPPEELPRLVAPLETPPEAGGADIAIGSRRVEGAAIEVNQPRRRVVIGRLFNRAVARLLVPGIDDTQCGFKGFRRGAATILFERTWVRGFGFDVELLFAARRLGLVVREVPVRWRDDARSTVRPMRDGLRVTAEVGKILVAWAAGRYRR